MKTAIDVLLIVGTLLGLVAMPVLFTYIRVREREHRAETERVRGDWVRREDWWQGTLERAEANAQREIAQRRDAMQFEREKFTERTERDAQRHAAEIERLTNLLTIGNSVRKEAVVGDGEPDAETRVLRQISEDSIVAGIAMLKEEYARNGIIVADEEVRDEVISMLMGTPFTPNKNISLVREEPVEATA